MRRPLRQNLALLGFALTVDGTASLTGGWPGMPLWWESRGVDLLRPPERGRIEPGEIPRFQPYPAAWFIPNVTQVPGREWISGAVIASGVGPAALSASMKCGRRRTA